MNKLTDEAIRKASDDIFDNLYTLISEAMTITKGLSEKLMGDTDGMHLSGDAINILIEARKTIRTALEMAKPKTVSDTEAIVDNGVLHSLIETKDRYNELLMEVENVYPNESRHETACRYIREREMPDLGVKFVPNIVLAKRWKEGE